MPLREGIRRHRVLIFRVIFFLFLTITCTFVLRYAIYNSPRAQNAPRIDSDFDYEKNAALTNSTVPRCDLQESATRYGIVFDAGSTGSRVHVYKYTKNKAEGRIDLHSEESYHTSPGLSSYSDPQEAAASLKPLLDFAFEKVPKRNRNTCTPVWLKATAGLRLLGVAKSVGILNEVHKLFATYPFHIPDDGVEMMDGKDEGPLAWLTVNFLLGNLDKAPRATNSTKTMEKGKQKADVDPDKPLTVGVVDMGGGSTQLVFAPDEPVDTLLYAPDVNTHVIHYFDRQFSLYQHSYLGFGLVEARSTIKKLLALQSNSTAPGEITQVPCFPPGYLEEIKVIRNAPKSHIGTGTQVDHSKESTQTVPIQGASHLYGFDQCMPVVFDALNKTHPCPSNSCSFNGVHQPTLEHAFKGDWYLMSKFYDLVAQYMQTTGKYHLTLEDYKQIAVDACQKTVSEDDSPNLCLDTTFLYVLLAHGYELPDTQPLYPRNKINGFELSWTLGAMIEEVA